MKPELPTGVPEGRFATARMGFEMHTAVENRRSGVRTAERSPADVRTRAARIIPAHSIRPHPQPVASASPALALLATVASPTMHVTLRRGASGFARHLPVTTVAALSLCVVFLQAQTAAPLPAEKKDTADALLQLEAFTVTGSNIKRVDMEKTLPVTVITREELEARDAATPMDQLAGIPYITDFPENETAVNAVAGRGDNANPALRGLGAGNTLVILNGRRMPSQPFTAGAISPVNVNVLPSFAQQIEVLRDGASAIYGSDAVAGVINYVVRPRREGGEVSLRYGFTEQGGGMDITARLGLAKKFASGKGIFVFGMSLYNRDAIYLREREVSQSADKTARQRPPFNVAGSAYDDRTNVGIWPSFRVGTATAVNWFYPVNNAPTPTITTTALPRALFADYNVFVAGQPMSARGSLNGRVEYKLTPRLTAFAEFTGYQSKSQTGRQPITLNSSDRLVTLSVDNPFNPFGSRFRHATGAPNSDGTSRVTGAPQTLQVESMLMADGGPEKIELTSRMFRLLVGLQGRFGHTSWDWEAGAMTGGVRGTDTAVNAIRDSKLVAAALRTDATAWSPFPYTFKVVNGAVVADQPYQNPASVRATYTEPAKRIGHSRLDSFDARAGGDVMTLWSGPLAMSFGTEWRREMKEDHREPFVGFNPPGSGLDPTDNDILVTSPKFPLKASRTVASAFAEAAVPLVSPNNQIPLVRSLELSTSARFERYSDFGNTTKPKFGLTWRPHPRVLTRISHNQGFRAPDLIQLYTPTQFSVASPPGERDPTRNNFLSSTALPAAIRVTDAQVLRKQYNIGNPDLQPELSKGTSIGLAVEVPGIKGLSVVVDYWEITQTNLILANGRNQPLDDQLLRAYTQAQLAAGVPIGNIDVGYRTVPGDESGNYKGDPHTLRAPVNAADRALFATANAALAPSRQLAPLGGWIGFINTNDNSTGRNFTNGFDYSLRYQLPRLSVGQFRLSLEWAQFLHKFSKTTPTDQKNDTVLNFDLPRTRVSLNLLWTRNAWNASVNTTYQSRTYTGATVSQATFDNLGGASYLKYIYNNGAGAIRELGDPQYQVNLGLGYRFGRERTKWLRQTSVRVGVNNLLDDQPSRRADQNGYSGSIGTSLWVGRAYSFSLTREL
jgi:iron complex outermembrane receptor protein